LGAAHPRFPRPPGSVTGGYYCAALRAMSEKKREFSASQKRLYANDLEISFQKNLSPKRRSLAIV
jgi:hypothetical protein